MPIFSQRGFAHLSLVVIVASVAFILFLNRSVFKNEGLTVKKASSSPAISTSLSPSPTPTPVPTPIPTVSSTATPSPKPSAAPVNSVSAPPSTGFGRIAVATERGTFNADIVTLDLSTGARMVTDTANDSDCPKDCPTIPLADFASRNGAFAAINGTYFCPAAYPECADKKDSFDFPVLNSKNKKWLNEGNFSWNNRSLIYQEGATMYYRQDANSYRGGPGGGIVNYPGILNNGQITVEQGQLSEKQGTKGTKGGIGFAGTKVYLVIAYNVDMADFAQLFKAIGAQNALNLDGGGSAALWYEGGYKVGPGRNLPNAVLFVR